MARKKVARVKDKWATKKWFTLLAPEYFGMVEIGETPANDPELVVGRTVETTLADLTGDSSNQNPYKKLTFKVHRVAGEKAYTKFQKFELMREYFNSLIRRRTSKIEDVIDIQTADGYRIRVKPAVFTVKRCKTSQKKAIRLITRQVIQSKGSLNFVQFLRECILGKVPSEIYKGAKKVYPIRRVEIKKIELLSEPKTEVVAG
ncbi:MAG: 30S ribosomal protein S3ae [Archaeoglobaceae archaeon]|nr:30S ribosomal protein S3ae [Archaeoglobaceae archaeon]